MWSCHVVPHHIMLERNPALMIAHHEVVCESHKWLVSLIHSAHQCSLACQVWCVTDFIVILWLWPLLYLGPRYDVVRTALLKAVNKAPLRIPVKQPKTDRWVTWWQHKNILINGKQRIWKLTWSSEHMSATLSRNVRSDSWKPEDLAR
jgi:hypothetical protein